MFFRWRLVRGCSRRSNGEGAQLACVIQAYAGLAVYDKELDGARQQPRNLYMTYAWSDAELKARSAALGRVEHLILCNNYYIPPINWHCLHTLTLSYGTYNLSHLPLGQIRELNIGYSSIVVPAALASRLALSAFTSWSGRDSIDRLLQGSRITLQHLSIHHLHDIGHNMSLGAWPNLKSLRVGGIHEHIDWLQHKQLQRLALDCTDLTAVFFAHLPPSLTHLSAACINDECLRAIVERCRLLEILDLRYCDCTADGYTLVQDECKALRGLRVGSDNFDDDMMRFFVASPFLSQRVTFLDLCGNTHVTEAVCIDFLIACPNIRGINIRSYVLASSFRAAYLSAHVLSLCPRLESVHCDKGEEEFPVPGLAVYYDPQFDLRCEQ